ncbi:MFS general substrate transporter [Saccharata proteae CBS 121410]|uniref:MFS general substrate transporter n=1 Tax=Saccharata proteae CBS 121410 TaxID=1314787 RepID=A0A9P4I074_9PEZI|nr:MFS general substrate transporter [Saccharata proteae CBS 121410]
MKMSKEGILARLHRFYRGTLFQAIVLGLVSFTQPGIWTGISNLGAGGEAQPWAVNAANVLTFGIMVFGAPVAGMVANIIGLRWVLAFGTVGYVVYSAGLYCNSAFGTEWLMLFGAATCGFSAAALWTAEAALAVGYPEPHRRGLYTGIWLCLNKLGSVISSAIQLALNAERSQTGSISTKTYLVLIGLQCLGLPLALLISPPEKLIREDGSKPVLYVVDGAEGEKKKKGKLEVRKEFGRQMKAFGKVIRRKEILLLLPIFISEQWGQTYQGNYLAAYFTVRARALAAFIIAIVGMCVTLLGGHLLDVSRWRRSHKARLSWSFIVVMFSAVWIWNLITQVRWQKEGPTLDWTSGGEWSEGVGIYVGYRIVYEFGGLWMYWVLGTYNSSVPTLALMMGLLRACESLGSAFSYAVGAVQSASLLTNLIVAAVMFWVSVPTSTWAAWMVKDLEVEGDHGGFDVAEGGMVEQDSEGSGVEVEGHSTTKFSMRTGLRTRS